MDFEKKVKNLINGALSGGISRTFVAPLERLKTINQVSIESNKNSIIHNLRNIWRTEGIMGMFRGNGINCSRIVPKSGIQWMSFNWASKYTDSKFGAGGISGLITATSLYPMETIRTRLSIQVNKSNYNGIIDCGKKIVKRHGFQGLYRGLDICLIGVIPLYAINFGLFHYTKQFLSKYIENTEINNIISGNLSMLGAIMVAFPSDLIKKQMQVRGDYNIVKHQNWWECTKHIWKNQGYRGFYRGLLVDLLKTCPANGMYFLCIGLLEKYIIR